jgi:adenine deaminase
VTINPAKQLRVDTFIGSLEPGKDADFAVWSKAPLDSGTVCQQTWIEGKKYFDRVHQQERANRLEAERKQLLAKARKVSPQTEKEGGAGGAAETEFFRSCLEHEFDGRDRHCMEE